MFTARRFERVVAVGADEGGAGLAKVIQVTQAAGSKILAFFTEGYSVEFLQVKRAFDHDTFFLSGHVDYGEDYLSELFIGGILRGFLSKCKPETLSSCSQGVTSEDKIRHLYENALEKWF